MKEYKPKKNMFALAVDKLGDLRKVISDFFGGKAEISSNSAKSPVSQRVSSPSRTERKYSVVQQSSQIRNENTDDSIIDSTQDFYVIPKSEETVPQTNTLNKTQQKRATARSLENSSQKTIRPNTQKLEVPRWDHKYIYSYSEIDSATRRQKEFYLVLKDLFHNQIFIDTEGNTNFSFILLYDLLHEYYPREDIVLLEEQLRRLSEFYPETRRYALEALIAKMKSRGDLAGAARIEIESKYGYDKLDRSRTGNKYKTKFNLSDEEVRALNRIPSPKSGFCSLDFCCREVIGLYLATIKKLPQLFTGEESNFDEQMLTMIFIINLVQYGVRQNDPNYKNTIEPLIDEIYLSFFKICENAVREHYGYRKKLKTDDFFAHPTVNGQFDERFAKRIKSVTEAESWNIAPLDEVTDIKLNALDSGRWRIKFDKLTANFIGNSNLFVEQILSLSRSNRENPSVEKIFFEASKFIAATDKKTALTFYLHYLYCDLKSAKVDRKPLPKTIQKSLFDSADQVSAFETIVADFIEHRDLKKAVSEIPHLFIIKRKQVKLDKVKILKINEEHCGTVELLNKLLQDEESALEINESLKAAQKIQVTAKQETVYISDIPFSSLQLSALKLFSINNLKLSIGEFEEFAKSHRALKNQLIDSLNEHCYNILDDLLIEEDEEYFTINELYYRKLLAL